MTKQVLDKLPTAAFNKVNAYRNTYRGAKNDARRREVAHVAMMAYVCGLRDAGLITDRERRIVFVYMTV